jgi:hypothetical protein
VKAAISFYGLFGSFSVSLELISLLVIYLLLASIFGFESGFDLTVDRAIPG